MKRMYTTTTTTYDKEGNLIRKTVVESTKQEIPDEDESIIYDGEIEISPYDTISKAISLFTLGVSAIAAVKLFNKVSRIGMTNK